MKKRKRENPKRNKTQINKWGPFGNPTPEGPLKNEAQKKPFGRNLRESPNSRGTLENERKKTSKEEV